LIANRNMIFLFSDFQFVSYFSSQVTHLQYGWIKRGYSDMWSMHYAHDTTNEFHFSVDTQFNQICVFVHSKFPVM